MGNAVTLGINSEIVDTNKRKDCSFMPEGFGFLYLFRMRKSIYIVIIIALLGYYVIINK